MKDLKDLLTAREGGHYEKMPPGAYDSLPP